MKTLPRRGTPRPVPDGPSAAAPGSSRVSWAFALLAVLGVALLIMGFYLRIYPRKGLSVPLGWDTARYVWRTSVVRRLGFRGLLVDRARPGFPALVGSLASVLGTSPLRLAAVVPALGAAATGLAAGAFVGVALRRPAWQIHLVAFGTATSFYVVRLAGPQAYQDNMLAGGVLIAAAVAIVLALEYRLAVASAIVLLGAGGIVHWAFFLVIAAVIALAAVFYLPESFRQWRRKGSALLETPTGRLGEVLAGGAAVAGGTIFGVLGAGIRAPTQTQQEFAEKLSRTLPVFRLPVTVPAAAVGAASLAPAALRPEDGSKRTRFALVFILGWCAVVLAGILANVLLHLRSPAHRFLSFAFVIPMLGLLGLLWAGELVARVVPWRRMAAALGGVLVAAGLLWTTATASHMWSANHPWFGADKVEAAQTADAYLSAAGVGEDRPVVFVNRSVDPSSASLNAHIVRIGLAPERIAHAYVFVGVPDDYLARRPTISPGQPDRTDVSKRFLNRIPFGLHPVALILRPFNRAEYERWAGLHAERVVTSGVAVVDGPVRPFRPPPVAVVRPYGYAAVAGLALGSLAVVTLAGLGWAVVLFGRWVRPVEVVALTPAVGIASLVLGGVLLDRIGLRLSGMSGVAAVVLVAGGGWAAAAWSRGVRRRPGEGSGVSR